jgi:hypothetical protein
MTDRSADARDSRLHSVGNRPPQLGAPRYASAAARRAT